MYRLTFIFILLAGWWSAPTVLADARSSSLYSEAEHAIYQIQVLNRKTGNKSTIGSGFLVARADIMATNYHVISDYANDPDNYRVEYLSTGGETGQLELLAVDVLHDLAVLKAERPLGRPLKTDTVPQKGVELYALGNPLDLGFSIVPGINNGVLSNSEENNIHFSGNLNPGMSGGPALNDAGNVVGINVATAGNDVSFLVSAHYLDVLLERIKLRSFKPFQDIHGDITNQLTSNSAEMLERLAGNTWNTFQIGNFRVPAEMGHSISCWDSSEEPEERGLISVYAAQCSNELQIFLDRNLTVGRMQYQYMWYRGEGMIAPRFYRNYESQNNSGMTPSSDKNSVTNFQCRTHFVDVSGQDFKMTVCKRDYIRYPGLSDVLITGVMVSKSHSGLMFDIYFPGAAFQSVITLFERMLEGFEWLK